MPRKTDGVLFELQPRPTKGDDGKPLLYAQPVIEYKYNLDDIDDFCNKYRHTSKGEMKRFIELLEEITTMWLKQGCRVETPFGSFAPKIKLLGEHTDPEKVNFEFDSYWFADGGASAGDWMRKIGKRMKLWHFLLFPVFYVIIVLPAVALGLEPPEKSCMTQPPRRSDESFFSGGLLWRMIIRGVFIALSTLASFTLVLKYSGSVEAARTAALCTLTVSQLIHVFECKSERKTLFSVDLLSNPFLVFSVAVSALVLFVCTYLPVLQGVFFTFALTRTQLVIALASAAVVPVLAAVFHKK